MPQLTLGHWWLRLTVHRRGGLGASLNAGRGWFTVRLALLFVTFYFDADLIKE